MLPWQGLNIAQLQEASVQNRRKLAEATREFKRNTAEDITKAVSPLLKQYQVTTDWLDDEPSNALNLWSQQLRLVGIKHALPSTNPILINSWGTH